MRARPLVSSVLLTLALVPSAMAAVTSEGGARLYAPAAFTGEASGTDAAALPKGVAGMLPEVDGEPFFLAVQPGFYSGRDARTLQAALAAILPAAGWKGDVERLDVDLTTELNTVPEREVEADRDTDTRALEESLERRFGRLSEVTLRALDLQADENESLLLQRHTAVRVRQTADGLPIRGLGLRVMLNEDGDIVGIAGALCDEQGLSGGVEYSAEKAERLAEEAIAATERVASVAPAEGLALATGKGLRPAWRVVVTATTDRIYEVFIDAETGEAVGVESLTDAAAPGQGMSVTPSPDGASEVYQIEVDDAVNNTFTLTHADIGTVTSGGADGCASTVSVPKGNGYADFAVSPYAGLSIEDATAWDYNCNFQEVNAFVQVTKLLYWFDGLGAEESPPIPIRVDQGTACGDGANQACAGGGKLTFGIGTATLGTPGFGNLYNSALDESVVAHELGHHVTRRQIDVGGGTLTGSMSEGLSDYWSMAHLNTDTFAAYWAKTTGGPVQSGFAPRQAESFDVFPEHLKSNFESHANGQVIAWAQLNVRTEMANRSALGAGLASRILVTALTGTGFGVTNDLGTEKEVYGSFQSLLGSELIEAGATAARADVLQAFARAGIFTTANEAVINISDDYLAPTDAPPTFTVWPGQDFSFNAAGTAANMTTYNHNYEVELANDEAFTVNLVTSGTLTNFAAAPGGNTLGTWSPSAKQWDTLTGGSVLYYRVRTWDDKGGTKRDSQHTMAGFMEVPTTAAVINGGGSAGCATVGGGSLGALGTLLGALAFIRRRR